MMPGDNLEFARGEAKTFQALPVTHAWDPERRLGELFAETLKLQATAWDVYFLYAPGVTWEGDEPPRPTFWMHQLPAGSGADWRLQLNPTTLFQELLKLLGNGVAPSRVDLGLLLHGKGIITSTRDRAQYTLEDIYDGFEDSKVKP